MTSDHCLLHARQRTWPAATRRRRQAGLTLLELVVAVLLGLVVLSGVLLTYIGSGVSDRQQRALGRMTEDAQVAMAMITRELQMAGYQQIQSVVAGGANGVAQVRQGASFKPVFGCLYGFTDNRAAFDSSVCNAAPTGTAPAGTPAIEINHEVTADTALANSNNALTDCQGTAVPGGNRVSNRFFVKQGGTAAEPVFELSCASNASDAQPLVPQVREVKVRYGVAPNWAAQDPATWRPQRFVTADVVDASNQWSNVVAVRVCLLMRSADPVLAPGTAPAAPVPSAGPNAAPTPLVAGEATYVDCDGVRQNAFDRHLYRAFKSTVTLRNRVS